MGATAASPCCGGRRQRNTARRHVRCRCCARRGGCRSGRPCRRACRWTSTPSSSSSQTSPSRTTSKSIVAVVCMPGRVGLHVAGEPGQVGLELGERTLEVARRRRLATVARRHGEEPEPEPARRAGSSGRSPAATRRRGSAVPRRRPTGCGTPTPASATAGSRRPRVSLATTALPSASCPVTTRLTFMRRDHTSAASRSGPGQAASAIAVRRGNRSRSSVGRSGTCSVHTHACTPSSRVRSAPTSRPWVERLDVGERRVAGPARPRLVPRRVRRHVEVVRLRRRGDDRVNRPRRSAERPRRRPPHDVAVPRVERAGRPPPTRRRGARSSVAPGRRPRAGTRRRRVGAVEPTPGTPTRATPARPTTRHAGTSSPPRCSHGDGNASATAPNTASRNGHVAATPGLSTLSTKCWTLTAPLVSSGSTSSGTGGQGGEAVAR